MTLKRTTVCRFFACLCLGLLAISAADDGNGYDEEAVRRGNKYIDDFLEEVFRNRAEEYDPYVIEDSVVGFNKKVLFVNVSGEAKLHGGYINGLSTLHRQSDCALENVGEDISVKADLGAGALDFHYSGSVKFMNYGPTISVEGVLSYIEVHIEFTADARTGRNGRLNKFIVDDIRGMKVRITGLGPLNWAINPIISGVTKLFKRFVRNFLENKVAKYITKRIQDFQFPVEGNEVTEAPEETAQPETEAPGETVQPEPETEASKENVQPEIVPETESPGETVQPETVSETEAPEETVQPETGAAKETPQHETEV